MNIWNVAGFFLAIFIVGALALIRWIAAIDKALGEVETIIYGDEGTSTVVIKEVELSVEEIVKKLSEEAKEDVNDDY